MCDLMRKKAVVLLSGGLDSSTTLAIAQKLDYLPYALSFRYGQRHACELERPSVSLKKWQRLNTASWVSMSTTPTLIPAMIPVSHIDHAEDAILASCDEMPFVRRGSKILSSIRG